MESITTEKGGQVRDLGPANAESGPSHRLPTDRREEKLMGSLINAISLLLKVQDPPLVRS